MNGITAMKKYPVLITLICFIGSLIIPCVSALTYLVCISVNLPLLIEIKNQLAGTLQERLVANALLAFITLFAGPILSFYIPARICIIIGKVITGNNHWYILSSDTERSTNDKEV